MAIVCGMTVKTHPGMQKVVSAGLFPKFHRYGMLIQSFSGCFTPVVSSPQLEHVITRHCNFIILLFWNITWGCKPHMISGANHNGFQVGSCTLQSTYVEPWPTYQRVHPPIGMRSFRTIDSSSDLIHMLQRCGLFPPHFWRFRTDPHLVCLYCHVLSSFKA